MGLPPRPFLYTLDQVATLLAVELPNLKSSYLYYDGRSHGVKRSDVMLTRNIAPVGERPDWRISEFELTRWLRSKRYRVYERAQFKDEV